MTMWGLQVQILSKSIQNYIRHRKKLQSHIKQFDMSDATHRLIEERHPEVNIFVLQVDRELPCLFHTSSTERKAQGW